MPVEVGQQSPDFTLTSTQRERVTLSDAVKDQMVVLAFYHFAFTGG